MAQVDHLTEKWMGFYSSFEAAEKVLQDAVELYNKNYLIISAKKDLVNENKAHTKGFFLFKFTIIKAIKDK